MVKKSLYIHIPFCAHRCAYCDFNTYAGIEKLIPDYVDALCWEMEFLAHEKQHIHTVFFGGGTPSLLSAHQIENILFAVRKNFALDPNAEISLEANPGSLSQEFLSDIHALGVNRLSLGLQSPHPQELVILDRSHSFRDVITAMKMARMAGFANINLDLMFAFPGQTIESWQQSLQWALELDPEHIALYALSVEHATPFSSQIGRGLLNLPDQDFSAQAYEIAQEKMELAGYQHYEISNWAKLNGNPDAYACLHNLQYWRNRPYLALGAGAHAWLGDYRLRNVLSPEAYIKRLSAPSKKTAYPRTPATVEAKKVDQQGQMAETMMMGLRLLQWGINADEFADRFGLSLEEKYAQQIDDLQAKELLKWSGSNNRSLLLTERGRFLGNQVFLEFL